MNVKTNNKIKAEPWSNRNTSKSLYLIANDLEETNKKISNNNNSSKKFYLLIKKII